MQRVPITEEAFQRFSEEQGLTKSEDTAMWILVRRGTVSSDDRTGIRIAALRSLRTKGFVHLREDDRVSFFTRKSYTFWEVSIPQWLRDELRQEQKEN